MHHATLTLIVGLGFAVSPKQLPQFSRLLRQPRGILRQSRGILRQPRGIVDLV